MVKIKVPKEFVINLIKQKEINLLHVYIAQKTISQKHYKATKQELIAILNKNFSLTHCYQLLNLWESKPYVTKEDNKYFLNTNPEKYYKASSMFKFTDNELTFTGNKLSRFLYCEFIFRNKQTRISRKTITELTGLTKQTQIKAEREFGVISEDQYIKVKKNKYPIHGLNRRLKKDTEDGYLLIQHTNVFYYQHVLGKVRVKQRVKAITHGIYTYFKNHKIDPVFRYGLEKNVLYEGLNFNFNYLLN